jgi:hypothetical protein
VTAHTWDLSEGLLLPPEQVLARWGSKVSAPQRIRGRGEAWIEGDQMFWIDGKEHQEIPLVEKSCVDQMRKEQNFPKKREKYGKKLEKKIKI